MRLDFNVLWVDDQPARIESLITGIKRQMEVEGFNLRPILCKNMADVNNVVASDVFTDEIDLILVDWDLGGGIGGQNAIAEIRESVPYKDVVFYSAQTKPEQLRSLAHDARLEGIYCVARDGLVEEVVGIFESLVKKVLDLDHARGIVMGATSDIDRLVKECLVVMQARLDDEDKQLVIEEVFELIERHIADITQRSENLRQAAVLEQILDARGLLTANDYLRILSRALTMSAFDEQRGRRSAVVEYLENVIPGRNRLAHTVQLPEGRPQEVVDETGERIDLSEVRELRRRILNLRQEFGTLLAGLRSM